MEIIITKNYEEMSDRTAEMFRALITDNANAVLGLATGSTPELTYKKLTSMHLDWSKVTTFNLDEYLGVAPTHAISYWFSWITCYSCNIYMK